MRTIESTYVERCIEEALTAHAPGHGSDFKNGEVEVSSWRSR
jgi:hypothetical protein